MVLVLTPLAATATSSAAVVSRHEVKAYLASDATDQKQRSLFLQAFSSIQTKKAYRDPRSFAQIAAIHGLPNTPYDSFPGDKAGGYCVHGDILFPTWHRPYLALLEKVLRDEAVAIAQTYTVDKSSWLDAAQNIRLPYWDWADDDSVMGVPLVFTDANVTIQAPPTGATTQIPNPLARFAIPAEQRKEFPASLGKLSSWANTTRYPNEAGVSDDFYCDGPPNSGHDQSLVIVEDWVDFSNHTMDQRSRRPGNYHSLEFIHDNIHGAVGGGGHMGYPDTAAFDPIFFFHHCNVDRLLALYMKTFEEYVPKNAVMKPLAPFRKAENGKSLVDFTWNSHDSFTTSTFGYTYPELGFNAPTLQRYMLAKYAPGRADTARMPPLPSQNPQPASKPSTSVPSKPVGQPTAASSAPAAPKVPAQVPVATTPAASSPATKPTTQVQATQHAPASTTVPVAKLPVQPPQAAKAGLAALSSAPVVVGTGGTKGLSSPAPQGPPAASSSGFHLSNLFPVASRPATQSQAATTPSVAPKQESTTTTSSTNSSNNASGSTDLLGGFMRTLQIQTPAFLQQTFGISTSSNGQLPQRSRDVDTQQNDSDETEEVFAHISVRRNVFNGPFTICINVNEIQAATFFVFARAAPELCANCTATSNEVISGALEITDSLLKPDESLYESSAWLRMVSVTARKMDGTVVPAGQVPSLKVHLRKSVVSRGGDWWDNVDDIIRGHLRKWDAEDFINDMLGIED